VVVEQSTEALLPMDRAAVRSWWTLNQGVLETLMIPLAVVMRNELRHCSSEVPFAQQNHAVETFLLDRPHKPLRVRIRIRGLIRLSPDSIPRLAQPLAHRRAPLRVPITHQYATRFSIRHRERPHDLSHERLVRMGCHPKHSHATRREVNDEHRVERHEA